MQDILESYNEQPVTKSRLYIVIMLLAVLNVGYFILDTFFYIESFAWRGFNIDWMNLVMGVLIPATGLGLFMAKTKGGWFILATYFSFIAMQVIWILGKSLFEMSFHFLRFMPIAQLFIGITSVSLSILLQLNSVRLRNRISTFTWVMMLIIAACFTMCFIFLT